MILIQVHNLAANPKYKDVVTELETMLLNELKETGDPRILGDGTTFEKPPYAGTSKPKKKK